MRNIKKYIIVVGILSVVFCDVYALICGGQGPVFDNEKRRGSYWMELAQRCDLPQKEFDLLDKRLSQERPISELQNVSGSPYKDASRRYFETKSTRCAEMAKELLCLEITIIEKQLKEEVENAKASERKLRKQLEDLKSVKI